MWKERERASALMSLLRGHWSHHEGPPSWPYEVELTPKGTSANTILLDVKASTYTFGRWVSHNSVHSMCFLIIKFSSVTHLCPTLCNSMDCSMPSFPVHQFLALAQTHVHQFGNTIQPCHLLSSPSPPAFNLPRHQVIFQWASSHQVAKVLEIQLQHQSFQWISWTDFL